MSITSCPEHCQKGDDVIGERVRDTYVVINLRRKDLLGD